MRQRVGSWTSCKGYYTAILVCFGMAVCFPGSCDALSYDYLYFGAGDADPRGC